MNILDKITAIADVFHEIEANNGTKAGDEELVNEVYEVIFGKEPQQLSEESWDNCRDVNLEFNDPHGDIDESSNINNNFVPNNID